MDAFSFALSIGTFNIKTKTSIQLSLLIGLFHFIMPMLGALIGNIIKQLININYNIITGVIFLFITIEMIKDFKKEEDSKDLRLAIMLGISLSVSLDSFAVGFTLSNNLFYIVSRAMIFTFFSSTFTFLGLHLGKTINKHIGQISKVVGILIMIFLAFSSFVKS